MTDIRMTPDALVMVCDGHIARFFSNVGSAHRPQLVLIQEIEAPPNPRSADQGPDQPGRVATPRGPISAVEASDPHERRKAEFIEHAADRLVAIAQARSAQSIIVAAPPRALALLRDRVAPEVRSRIVAELDKDYTKTPVLDLTRLLTSAANSLA